MKSHAERSIPATRRMYNREQVVAFVDKAIKEEREACADIAHHHGHASDGEVAWDERNGIRRAILARSE